MELVAPILLVAAVVLVAVWATRILWFAIKVAVVAALVYLILSVLKPEWIKDIGIPRPLPKIVTALIHP